MNYLFCALFFFFNDTATTEIYTLSLHDALPICAGDALAVRKGASQVGEEASHGTREPLVVGEGVEEGDRKSTRLNSSHANISYAVFCLKKKTILAADSASPAVSGSWRYPELSSA